MLIRVVVEEERAQVSPQPTFPFSQNAARASGHPGKP
jgi:hypothetical protein